MASKKQSGKTVYVLGAGFSMDAGGPSQNQILPKIFELKTSDSKIKKARKALRSLLVGHMGIKSREIATGSLEDIFTPIDRCLADGLSFRGKNLAELQVIRQDLELLISEAINQNFIDKGTPKNNAYVRKFADYLVEIARKRGVFARMKNGGPKAKKYDPLAIISLNWDVLLDNALNKALKRENPANGYYAPFGVVDYCCYISSIEKGHTRIRTGLWSLGCKGFNVKLLKIHGSMNWLQCPGCQRLFVGFGEKYTILNHRKSWHCRYCDENRHKNPLQGALIMPTFLKDLSNFQIKLVWHNAGVELMEADHIVFIGYSLPQADFEFRQLLSRMIRKKATVTAVLFDGNTKEDGTPIKKYIKGSETPTMLNFNAEKERYEQFFSGHSLSFLSGGVAQFVASLPNLPKRSP